MTVMIVEGCDLSGKTYAIERIGKYFNSGITIKNNYKPKTSEDSTKLLLHYWNIVGLIQKTKSDTLTILDRFHLSQQVYSILRNVDEMYDPEIEHLENFLMKQNYLLLYIDTPLPLLLERYEERGDEHIKRVQLALLKKRYDVAFKNSKLTKMAIDTTKIGWLKQVEEFVKWNGYERKL